MLNESKICFAEGEEEEHHKASEDLNYIFNHLQYFSFTDGEVKAQSA